MLDEYKVSDQFWVEAINTACHAINRLYLHKILNKTAYELLLGKKPNVYYFRVFGSNASFLTRSPKTLNLHLKLMKVSFLVMPQMIMAIVSSTKPSVVLKLHVM
jgi:hypothetical protein